MKPNSLSRVLLIALPLILLGFVYSRTQSDCLTEDSVDYAKAAMKGGWGDLLHPHHLLYNPSLALVGRGILGKGADLESLRVLQNLNLAASLVAVLLFALLLRELGLPGGMQLWCVAFFGFAHGFWAYSSQIEVYNWTAACIVGTTLCWLREERGKGRSLALGPLLATFGMLIHQTAIFFNIALAVYMWRSKGLKDSRGPLLRFVALPMVIVGVCYVAATRIVSGASTPRAILYYATAYAHSGWWGGLRERSFRLAVRGFADSVVSVDSIKSWVHRPSFLVAGALVMLGGLILGFRKSKRAGLSKELGACLWLLLPWMVLHAAFVSWWYPDNIEFWIVVLPAVTILGGGFAVSLGMGERGWGVVPLFLVLLLEIGANAQQIGRTCRGGNQDSRYARDLCQRTEGSDLVLTTGQGRLGSYLQYFCRVPVVPVHGFFGMKDPGPDSDITAALIQGLEPRVRAAFDGHGRVFVDESLWNGQIVSTRDMTRLDAERFQTWLHGHSVRIELLASGKAYVLLQ